MTPKRKPEPFQKQKKFLSTQGSIKIYYDLDSVEARREAMEKNGVTPKEVMEAGLKALGIKINDRYS